MAKKLLPKIDAEGCVGCESCVNECPAKCLELIDDIAKLTKPADCTSCGTCKDTCPAECITMEEMDA
jgi:NAD-dependent dihydropyrimidine dehydrogenase PreA subunit